MAFNFVELYQVARSHSEMFYQELSPTFICFRLKFIEFYKLMEPHQVTNKRYRFW